MHLGMNFTPSQNPQGSDDLARFWVCSSQYWQTWEVLCLRNCFDISSVSWHFFKPTSSSSIILLDPVKPRVSVQKGGRKTFNKSINSCHLIKWQILVPKYDHCHWNKIISSAAINPERGEKMRCFWMEAFLARYCDHAMSSTVLV